MQSCQIQAAPLPQHFIFYRKDVIKSVINSKNINILEQEEKKCCKAELTKQLS